MKRKTTSKVLSNIRIRRETCPCGAPFDRVGMDLTGATYFCRTGHWTRIEYGLHGEKPPAWKDPRLAAEGSMNQKEKVQLLKETLGELCEEVGAALGRAKGALHDVTYGPGPAGPVVVDLGRGIERRLAGLIRKTKRRLARKSTKR